MRQINGKTISRKGTVLLLDTGRRKENKKKKKIPLRHILNQIQFFPDEREEKERKQKGKNKSCDKRNHQVICELRLKEPIFWFVVIPSLQEGTCFKYLILDFFWILGICKMDRYFFKNRGHFVVVWSKKDEKGENKN